MGEEIPPVRPTVSEFCHRGAAMDGTTNREARDSDSASTAGHTGGPRRRVPPRPAPSPDEAQGQPRRVAARSRHPAGRIGCTGGSQERRRVATANRGRNWSHVRDRSHPAAPGRRRAGPGAGRRRRADADRPAVDGAALRGLGRAHAPATGTAAVRTARRVPARTPWCSTSCCPTSTGSRCCAGCATAAPAVPVLFLTARDAVEDRIAGLTAGGDDYVTKPFSLEEVVARLRALLRRAGIDRAARRTRCSASAT